MIEERGEGRKLAHQRNERVQGEGATEGRRVEQEQVRGGKTERERVKRGQGRLEKLEKIEVGQREQGNQKS